MLGMHWCSTKASIATDTAINVHARLQLLKNIELYIYQYSVRGTKQYAKDVANGELLLCMTKTRVCFSEDGMTRGLGLTTTYNN